MQTLDIFMKVYKKSWECSPMSEGAKLYEACKDAKYPNGQPLNILKAVMILKEADCMVRINWLGSIHYELLLRYISDVSGYGVTELSERVAI